MKIALIGTGMMGERMGGRLLDAGHELAVYNRTRVRTASLEARGASVADTPRAAAAG
jgi:3-hydroxyisobutyrate dehydrogenase